MVCSSLHLNRTRCPWRPPPNCKGCWCHSFGAQRSICGPACPYDPLKKQGDSLCWCISKTFSFQEGEIKSELPQGNCPEPTWSLPSLQGQRIPCTTLPHTHSQAKQGRCWLVPLREIKSSTPLWWRSTGSGYSVAENKGSKKNLYMFTAALFTTLRGWKSPKCLSPNKCGKTKCGISMQWTIIQW